MKIKDELAKVIELALSKSNMDVDEHIVISDSSKPQFGDYQYNGVMPLAKKLKMNPRELASEVIRHIDSELIEKVEVAGPGFINITLSKEWLENTIPIIFQSERLGVSERTKKDRVVIDYSSPNMAKEMHVGHLRSTIIGDSLVKVFEFLGDIVIRQNHIGDWGTQFGMLIAYLEISDFVDTDLSNLELFYKKAKKEYDDNEEFAKKARSYVVQFQANDEYCLELWKKFISLSLKHCEDIYQRLGVSLTYNDVRGESFYNDTLPSIVETLGKSNLITEANGAKCVFLDKDKAPVIVQKSDGGYLYATTDLAAIKFRNEVLKADKILYIVDFRQQEHFQQVFELAQKADFSGSCKMQHIKFGTMLSETGKPYKTRDGGTIKLINLLDESVKRAKENLLSMSTTLKKDKVDNVANIIGIGAVKYADLSINRESDYIFSFDKMLSFDGNTSVYIQYAYVRANNILNKVDSYHRDKLVLNSDIECELGIRLLKFEDILLKVSYEYSPHVLCLYLYELATTFMKFYEKFSIIGEENTKVKDSRLLLTQSTAKTLKKGLELLGIDVIDRM